MKNKFIHLTIFIFILVFVMSKAVFAMGRGMYFDDFYRFNPDEMAIRLKNMFEVKASILGLNVEEIKNCWAQGKNMIQCAKEHGITEQQFQQKIKDYRLSQLKTMLETLVDKGIITQKQADERLNLMQSKFQEKKYFKKFDKSYWPD